MRSVVCCVLAAGAIFAAEDSYRLEIEKDRKETQEFWRSERSPLRQIGRFTVREGDSKIGSDASAEFQLPPRAPRLMGTIHRTGADISFEAAAGVSVLLNGKAATGRFGVQAVAAPKPIDHVSSGDFSFSIRPIGENFIMMLSDAQSEFLKDFKGLTWFPIDTVFRVEARFEPVGVPRNLTMQTTDGGSRAYPVAGDLVFECAGQKLRLMALMSPDQKSLFVAFRDQTSGKETYGGGRFLEADLPKDGKTVVDFNKAYNPYCAYSPYSICPVVPRENRIWVAIRAGERLEGH